MYGLFKENVIKRFIANRGRDKSKPRFFNPTFQLDPVQLCLKIIDKKMFEANDSKQDNMRKAKAKKAADRKEAKKEKEENATRENVDEGDVGEDVEMVIDNNEEDAKEKDVNENINHGDIDNEDLDDAVAAVAAVDDEIEEVVRDDAPSTKVSTSHAQKLKNQQEKNIAQKNIFDIAIKEKDVQHVKGSFFGVDFGMHNVVCAVHSRNEYDAVVVSRKEFNNNVGVTGKTNLQERDFKKRLMDDPDFKTAVDDRTKFTLKTSDIAKLEEAVISRIGNYKVMYSFYGDSKYTLDRFMNKNNQDREFARIVDLLFVGDVTNLVCGNATMPNGLKGSQHSLDKKFCAYVERVKGEGTIIFCSEHRTSVLDSNTRKYMSKPMMKLSKKKEEKRRKWIEKRDAEVAMIASNNNNNANLSNDSILPSWGGGEDRKSKLLEIGSKGAGIFRQEKKVAKVDEGGEKKKEKECNDLVSVWGLYQVSMPGYSYLWNRDINAAINIVNIYLHLLEYKEVPWEFRKDVKLMKISDYIPAKLGSVTANT
jgi:hypothetical protein